MDSDYCGCGYVCMCVRASSCGCQQQCVRPRSTSCSLVAAKWMPRPSPAPPWACCNVCSGTMAVRVRGSTLPLRSMTSSTRCLGRCISSMTWSAWSPGNCGTPTTAARVLCATANHRPACSRSSPLNTPVRRHTWCRHVATRAVCPCIVAHTPTPHVALGRCSQRRHLVAFDAVVVAWSFFDGLTLRTLTPCVRCAWSRLRTKGGCCQRRLQCRHHQPGHTADPATSAARSLSLARCFGACGRPARQT